MAIAGGLPEAAVYIMPDSDPNAFATGPGPREGLDRRDARACSDALNREELQGVVVHEMSHVRNYDIRLMTVVAALVGVGPAPLRLGAARPLVGRRAPTGPRTATAGAAGVSALVFFVLWLVSLILAPLIAQLVALAVSREREYLADASGAELTRNPLALASALQKIEAAVEPTASIKQGVAHLCIADPRGRAVERARKAPGRTSSSTHPPIARRIALLKEMGYQKA